LPNNGFSLKTKHVTRHKTGTNLVLADGLYFPSYPSCFMAGCHW